MLCLRSCCYWLSVDAGVASLKFLMFSLLLASLLFFGVLGVIGVPGIAFVPAVAGAPPVDCVFCCCRRHCCCCRPCIFTVPADHDDDLRFVLYSETYVTIGL